MSEPYVPTEFERGPSEEAPARRDVSGGGFAWVLLVAANVAVFVLMLVNGSGLMSPDVRSLIKFGANYGPLTMSTDPWRLFTAMFVHIGLLHIACNMIALVQLGPMAESLFGTPRFLLLYLLAGLGGSIASNCWNPETVSAGASGAIFGIVGALLGFVLSKRNQLAPHVFAQQFKSMMMFVGINLYIGYTVPHIDNSAHIGGLLTGLVLGFFALESPQAFTRKSFMLEVVATAFVIGVLAFGGVYAHSRAAGRVVGAQSELMLMDEMPVDQATLSYDRAIPKELVTKFADELKLTHYGDSKASVMLFKASPRAEIGFVIRADAVNSPDVESTFTEYSRYFSARVFGGKPVDIRLFDPTLKELKTIKGSAQVAEAKTEKDQ